VKTRPEIDASRVFLVGHSEGGMIAPMVAAQDPSLRGIVLLAGPGWTGRKIMEYQTRNSVDLQAGTTPAQRDSMYRIGLASLDSAGSKMPWVQYFSEYDPLPVVRNVRAPVLIVHGATDRQVTAEQAEILGNTLRIAGNTDVAVHVLPDVNHLFLSDPVGHVAGYSALSKRTVVPQLLQLVTDWIANKSK
jgi:dipeptidyl aminopeptidase/acylaminoacyl peptidase